MALPRYAIVGGVVVPDAPSEWCIGARGLAVQSDVLLRLLTDLRACDFPDIIRDAPGRVVTDSHGTNRANPGCAGVVLSVREMSGASDGTATLYAKLSLDRHAPAGAALLYALDVGLVRGLSMSMCTRIAPTGEIERVVVDIALCATPRREGTSVLLLENTDVPPPEIRAVPDWVFGAVSEYSLARSLMDWGAGERPTTSVYCVVKDQ